MKTRDEIHDQIDKANEDPGFCSGMSYTDGVKAALEWVLGETDEPAPMEDA